MMATEAGNAAIAAMYEADYGQSGVEAEETPIAQPEAAVEPEEGQQEAAPATPDPEDSVPEIPPDIQALLEEPDFEAEAEQEFVPEPEDEEEVYLDESDALAKERKARLAAEKKLKWMEDKRVESEGKHWAEEAEKYFPLAGPFLDKINANSRRAYLRAARDYHDRALKASEKVNPSAPAVNKEALKAELRAELEAAWGKPVVGPGKAPIESAEKAAAIEEARSKRDLLGIQRARGTTQKIWGNLYEHQPQE